MPIYPDSTPDWLKPENASVLDSPITSGLRAVYHFLGGDDPSSVMGTVAPMMAADSELGPLAKKAVSGIKGLYSRVQQAAEGLPEFLHPVKAQSVFKNLAPKEEVDFRGLGDFLNGQQGNKVAKSDILSHLEANPAPQVDVKTLGDSGEATHFDRPSLKVPGGSNYTESLFQLQDPTTPPPPTPDEINKWHYNKYGSWPLPWDPEIGPDSDLVKEYLKDTSPDTYSSPHWDTPNVLAHTREDIRGLGMPDPATLGKWTTAHLTPEGQMMANEWKFRTPFSGDSYSGFGGTQEEAAQNLVDYLNKPGYHPLKPPSLTTGDQGKFLQEVQSDWHQSGKEKGYRDPQVLSDVEAQLAKVRAQNSFLSGEYKTAFGNGEPARVQEMLSSQIHENNKIEEDLLNQRHDQRMAAPDAPFKDTWPDLALKKHVLDVAQNPDLNWLGFTSGESQADRYDLSRHVTSLSYDTDGVLRGYDHSGKLAISEKVDEDGLAAMIGHEPAMKLLSMTPDMDGNLSIRGQDLQVGGKGMRHFYDEVLPSRLNKIVKPFGGTVEPVQLPTPGAPAPVMITNGGEGVMVGGQKVASAIPHLDEIGSDPNINNPALWKQFLANRAALKEQLTTQETQKAASKTVPAWIARMTPEMKAEILKKGLPLMSLMGLLHSHDQDQTTPNALAGLKSSGQ